ncbi:aminopeptidase N [Mycobacterium sp. Aquia_213]|uniref:aminopeptidase N n=1 Tax=Mycobacterium sp. Aquia_213 TaxID=2991728 RepID=UPI00226F770C|nr:aminopeptidase N [Mycobacterium sp. Aquia_213]WAC90202.1 aminopeptidase N [Mycobacterium sp. Aquia_213]
MTTVDPGAAPPVGDPSTRRSANLTRQDAATRAKAIEVESYQILIDLADCNGASSTDSFHTTTTVSFTAQPGARTFIDMVLGASGAVRSAVLNSVAIDITGYDDNQGLTLTDLAVHNSLVVEADYTYSHDGEGLYRFQDPSDNEIYLYTQFETAAAKRVFACFDQPDLKASFELTVVAPEAWVVVANTLAVDIDAAGNTKVHKFAPTARISTYLVALIAGPYVGWADSYTDKPGAIEIPLRIFCRKSLRDNMDRDAEQLFALTKRGFAFYHSNFGVTYPFGKYDQVFCPAYNAGAMENVAAVTFTDDLVFRGQVTRSQKARRAETLLHEMAHMWFGDLVTMEWWDDLWLNESFATWASNLCLAEATDFAEAWTTFANVQKPTAYRQDQLPTTHPVADDVPSLDFVYANFDPITYIKGASTLKQLVAYIGREHFLSGLRDYFTAHAYGNATLKDLLDALQQKATDRDLHAWAKQWLKTTGLTTLRADFDVNSGNFTRFAVNQTHAQPGGSEPRAQRIQIAQYEDDGTGKLALVGKPIPVDATGARTEVPQLHGVARGKLILVNDHDDTYCSLHLDAGSLDTALSRIGDIADSLPRAQVWSTMWEMTRNGALRPRDFAALVTSTVHAEHEVAVVQNLILQTQTTLASYAQPAWASAQGWPTFADRLLELARGAEAGSDEQLVFINGLGADRLKERQRSGVLFPRHTEVLSALLDVTDPNQLGKIGLSGLRLDDDLRWRFVIALATAGIDDADRFIEAQSQRDSSDTGRLNALQARAAQPVAENKERVWRQVLETEDISNSDARALAAGFAAPGQGELLAPYTVRYFYLDSLVAVWNNRPEAVASTIVTGLYPTWDISQDGIDAAKAFLARSDVPAPLSRLIREQQADVVRAVAVRAVDTQP